MSELLKVLLLPCCLYTAVGVACGVPYLAFLFLDHADTDIAAEPADGAAAAGDLQLAAVVGAGTRAEATLAASVPRRYRRRRSQLHENRRTGEACQPRKLQSAGHQFLLPLSISYIVRCAP